LNIARRDMETHRTTCKIGACEPFCGLEVDVENGRMVTVRPDPAHPITTGYACIKGMHVAEYQNDPDRLLRPERKTGTGWEQLDWDTATREIGQRLRAIADAHGPRAIATYWGNAADSMSITLANTLCHSFGSPNSFNVLSLEYTDRGAVAGRMLGNENLILQPDAGRTKFALLLGTNPIVTQGMTLLQRRPRIAQDFKTVQSSGGKLVVVDPRTTESARLADEHIAIRPGTDLFLLLGMLHWIVTHDAHDRRFVAAHCADWDALAAAVAGVDLQMVSEVTDISRATIERLAEEFASAESAFATTRVGVQTSPNTTLTEWAVQALNAITGNVDRPGGVYFNPGAIDIPALIEKFTKRRNPAPSRIGGFPQIFGGPPASVLAEDVLSEDPERIRALVVIAGNPVITFPNTPRIEAALRRLDLLVCVDLYRSDTGSFAHYNLPAATHYEKGSFHFLTSTFEPYPYAEWKPKVVEPRGEARSEWDIVKGIAREAGVPFLNDPLVDRAAWLSEKLGFRFNEDHLYRFLLLGKTRLGRLKKTPGGIKFGDIVWGDFLRSGLHTKDRRIHLAPADLLAALAPVLEAPPLPTQAFPFLLISGARRTASYNSWTHNIPALMDRMKGNWATVHPSDAEALGVRDGERARVTTEVGSVEIELRSSPDIRRGVVSVHQFWGHVYESGTMTSRRFPGVNVNVLHDDRCLDQFSGMPIYNGRPCRIERLS
jgi:anaerobic selenocysteine-containing dehydrogenase